MSTAATPDMNVKQSVPFFRMSDVEHRVRLYMRGLHHEAQAARGRKVALVLLGTGWRALIRQTHVKDGRALISVRNRRETVS